LSRREGVDAPSCGVLSIGKLAAGQEGYYLEAVVHGAEEYYLGAGEVPGYWVGTGAGLLGLDGTVSDDAFIALLNGVNPTDGTALGRPNRRLPALDLTFSAPKSVSVAWALGGPELAREIVAAHEEAIGAALGYLEREAVFVRRGHNGAGRLIGGGLVGAAFRHRTSRAGDPQLHTHVVVANAAQGPDGRWSALDARHLYAHARTAGFLYQAELRAALSARLNADWEPTVKGTGDLSAVPVEVRREFSQRRAQIEAVLGPDATPREARVATLRTRPAKTPDVDAWAMHDDWVDRANALGFTTTVLHTELTREAGASGGRLDPSRPSVTDVCTELTEHRSTFDRRHVLQALAGHAHQGATVADLEAETDRLLAEPDVVPLGVGRFGICYSTPELLALEERILNQADRARDIGDAACGVVPDPNVTLFAHPELSGEQARMVETITTDGAPVSVVVGAAGSGKTHALAAAREAWDEAGYTVIGCALAARAARQLQDDSRIPSVTLDRLLIDLDRPDPPHLTARTVIVVDEAAMIGTRKLGRLLDHAHHAHAKVVLVGDPCQLPEIEAGGTFTGLAERLGTVELVENRRQHDPIERQALAELRAGQIDEAIERLAEHGHIIPTPNRHAALEHLVGDWRAATRHGDDAIMLALHRTDVAALNDTARTLLIAERVVDDWPIYANGRPYAVGDRIITLHNDHRHGLINGQRGTITNFEDAGFAVHFDHETRPRLVPDAYLEAGHVDHGYAMTVHKAQGLTCDRAYVLGTDDLYAEAGYTALSRGRHENRLYITADHDAEVDHHGVEAEDDDPITSIRTALYRSERQELATSRLAGNAPARIALHATLDRQNPVTLSQGSPGHDDGNDLGW
jgi:conjugative relaxase-like TrwC/TraI family protein